MDSAHRALVPSFVRIRFLVKASTEGRVDEIIRNWVENSSDPNLLFKQRKKIIKYGDKIQFRTQAVFRANP